MDKAVILARGLGTRMRKQDDKAVLTREQAGMADSGIKALIRIDRPFLDYVLHMLAQVGYKKICLVIGPEHDAIRTYYTQTVKTRRLSVDFAIQEKPLGTADAVAAAEKFAGNDNFLVINSDNYYPSEALAGLREIAGPGLAGFEKEGMLQGGNIPADRLTRFAVIQTDRDGYMVRIIEKPDQATIDSLPAPVCVSMNCWRFSPAIFKACKSIPMSPRGELELPDAVQHSMVNLGQRYKVVVVRKPVLDLSSRSDISAVTEKLAGTEVNL